MRKWPAASTWSVAPVPAAASLTPSLVPSKPVPLICSVISVVSPPRGSLLLSAGRLDAVQRVPDRPAVIHSGSASGWTGFCALGPGQAPAKSLALHDRPQGSAGLS